MRTVRFLIFAVWSMSAVASAGAAACSRGDYGEEPAAVDSGVDVAVVDSTPPSEDVATTDAGPTCPSRFLPQEGTYSYRTGFAGDELRLDDASQTTQAFSSPFFATVRHLPNGCWTIRADFADGPDGRHGHAWTFCNVCNGGDAASLDLVSEDDDLRIASLSTTQTSHYECASPNPYLVTDLAPDAAIAQSSCTGTSTGTEKQAIQVNPVFYRFIGVREEPYGGFDAGVPCHCFEARTAVVLEGSSVIAQPSGAVDTWCFDSDSGVPMWMVIERKTQTKLGAVVVDYKWNFNMRRIVPTVSPLLPADQ